MKFTITQTDTFEVEAELEGVLPSIEYIKEHLSRFDDQFSLVIKHLDNAAKATLKIGTSS